VANAPAAQGSTTQDLRAHALQVRRNVLQMTSGRGEGYAGQGLGCADILTALYRSELNFRAGDPQWPERDRFILSVGHYAVALYAVLAEVGILDDAELAHYAADGDRLPASTHHTVRGVEATTGSLGQGLSLAAGMALAARMRGDQHRVFCLLSDGEMQEGSTWEAAMFSAHQRLERLVAIVDVNRTQADGDMGRILEVEPVADKWRAFGWEVAQVDGNDIEAVAGALHNAGTTFEGSPHVIVCATELGAGVPLITSRERAHFVRVAEDEWRLALSQLEEGA
jgi:transketolase